MFALVEDKIVFTVRFRGDRDVAVTSPPLDSTRLLVTLSWGERQRIETGGTMRNSAVL
jgi:hypothetical protein